MSDEVQVVLVNDSQQVAAISVESPAQVVAIHVGVPGPPGSSANVSAHEADVTAHPAKNITFTPVGPIAATNAQDAIAELADEIGTNTVYVAKVEFSYGDVTILPLYLAQSGDRITHVELLITNAFNDQNATLTAGDSGNTARLMSANQNEPNAAHSYESSPNHLYSSPTQINLYISAGTSSQGAGIAYLYTA